MSVITEPCCTVLGREWPCGVYLLRIEVAETLVLAFGRFRHGQPITVLPGAYVYTGSAMGQRGANSLAHRLLRHATRSGGKVPHPIRADLLTFFPRVHLSQGLLRPPGHKKLFWHIDYLLDCEPIALCHIFIVRTHLRLETAVARLLQAEPGTAVPAKGLGASDISGNTHLLRVTTGESWWQFLPTRLNTLREKETISAGAKAMNENM